MGAESQVTEVVEPEVTEPEVAESEVAESEVAESQVTEVVEPEVTEPEVTESQATSVQVTNVTEVAKPQATKVAQSLNPEIEQQYVLEKQVKKADAEPKVETPVEKK